jgi:hypothetical protein
LSLESRSLRIEYEEPAAPVTTTARCTTTTTRSSISAFAANKPVSCACEGQQCFGIVNWLRISPITCANLRSSVHPPSTKALALDPRLRLSCKSVHPGTLNGARSLLRLNASPSSLDDRVISAPLRGIQKNYLTRSSHLASGWYGGTNERVERIQGPPTFCKT